MALFRAPSRLGKGKPLGGAVRALFGVALIVVLSCLATILFVAPPLHLVFESTPCAVPHSQPPAVVKISAAEAVTLQVWPRPRTPVGPQANVSLVSAFCDRGVMTAWGGSQPEGRCNFVLINAGVDQIPTAKDEDPPDHPTHAAYGWQCLLCTARPSAAASLSRKTPDDDRSQMHWSGVLASPTDPAAQQPPRFGASPRVDLSCHRSPRVEMVEDWAHQWKWNAAQFKCEMPATLQGDPPAWGALVMEGDSWGDIEARLLGDGSLARFVGVEDLVRSAPREVEPGRLSIGTCLHSPIYKMKSLDDRRRKMVVEWVAYNLFVLRVSRVYIYVGRDDLAEPLDPLVRYIFYMAANWNVTLFETSELYAGRGYNDQYEIVADCYYRGSAAHDYIAFHDFDEFPTSAAVDTTGWTDSLGDHLAAGNVGVFRLEGLHMLGMCPHSGVGIDENLVTAREVYTEKATNRDRLKHLVAAGVMKSMYVHHYTGMDKKLKEVNVDPAVMYIRHFTESRLFSVDNCSSVELEKNGVRSSYILLRFQQILSEQVDKVLKASDWE